MNIKPSQMKQIIFTALLFAVLLFNFQPHNLYAAGNPAEDGDILVHVRLYEGSRGNEIQKSSVVSTYFLKPLFISSLIPDVKLEEEKNELKRIFNLNHIKLMTSTNLGWKYGENQKRFQMIVLNGHEFLIQLTMKGQKNNFKVEVFEKSSAKKNKIGQSLLETDLVLPEKKSTVFGFEDSLRKPFFICLQREENQSIIDKEPLQVNYDESRLIKRVPPVYPKEALEKNIEGPVVMEAVIDKYGRVVDLKVVSGKKELRIAAIKAVKYWIFEPYIVKGKPHATKFTIMVNFNLPTSAMTNKNHQDAFVGEPMDFVLENAPLKDLLVKIARKVKINIVVDPGIACKVSCNLKNTPWDKALDMILQVNGLDMFQKGNVLRIVKATPYNKKIKNETTMAAYQGKPGTYKYHNADLVTVIKEIVKNQDMKLHIQKGIKGKVTTHLANVPWDQFLDLILHINGLEKELKGGTLYIKKGKTGAIPAIKKSNKNIPDIFPTKGYLRDAFGKRIHPLTKKEVFHNGMDIAAKKGTKVVAPADGKVLVAEHRTYYGNLLIIDHGNGYQTRYGHLAAFKVKEGDQIKKGQTIAFVGSTGRSPEPHLHYEVRINGKPVNPLSLIKK